MNLPYVYKLTNETTGEYYFGYRSKNVRLGLRSEDDLGKVYFTSSKYVKPRFTEFSISILAEFFSITDAYDYEQSLIAERIDDELCLNKHYQTRTGKRFKHDAPHSNSARQKMKKPHGKIKRSKKSVPVWNKGLTKDTDHRMAMMAESRKRAGNPHQIGKPRSEQTRSKLRDALIGREVPQDQRQRMSAAKKGKTWEEIYGEDGAAERRNARWLPTGASHHKSRAVKTPDGVFTTVTAAALHYGVGDGTIRNRANSNSSRWTEWAYLDAN